MEANPDLRLDVEPGQEVVDRGLVAVAIWKNDVGFMSPPSAPF